MKKLLFITLNIFLCTTTLAAEDPVDTLVYAKRRYKSVPITDRDKLDEAQALAYTVLVEETGVVSKTGGFTGSDYQETKQMFLDSRHGLRLVDEFDVVSQWFGVYFEDKLIGCSRLFSKRPEDNKMLGELFNPDLPEEYKTGNVLEIGRLCGLKEFRGKGLILTLLHKKMLEFAREHDASLLTYTEQPNVMHILRNLSFEDEGVTAKKYNFIFLPTHKTDESLSATKEKLVAIIDA